MIGTPRAPPSNGPGAPETVKASGASRWSLLSIPQHGLQARIDLFRRAKKSIDACYYEFHPGAVGLIKLSLLRDAARRGVKVRLLLDSIGSRIPKALVNHLVEEGVEIRYFHPLRFFHPSWLWRRMHTKWSIIDGDEMIVGDRNMGDGYFNLAGAKWRTREIYIAGDAARQAAAYSGALWESADVKIPRRYWRARPERIELAGKILDKVAERLTKHASSPDNPWLEGSQPAKISFSHDPLGWRKKTNGTGGEMLSLIDGARETIILENAYVAPTREFKDALARAVRRGVKVRLITNSRQSHNIKIVYAAYQQDLEQLAALGLEIWEYQGSGTLHAKNIVIDSKISYVGSYNLDPRSFALNLESGAIIEDVSFSQHLESEINTDLTHCKLVAKQGKILVSEEPAAHPFIRRLKRALTRALLAVLRSQL